MKILENLVRGMNGTAVTASLGKRCVLLFFLFQDALQNDMQENHAADVESWQKVLTGED